MPTPKAIIGDIAGAPGKLPYTAQVHEYMRMLEKASPRVKVFSIGKSEEGREMIAVAIADAPLIAKLDENRARLAKLADPRSIKLDDAEADRLVAASTPIYYITGTIHSPETGAPTALMELAYRLAVDDAPVHQGDPGERDHDDHAGGRGRTAATARSTSTTGTWPTRRTTCPPLVYWGKYLVHDNNRDAMGATLALTRNVINTFVDQKAQLLHDLHESVPFLYDNTVGDGPYNAWVDPILTDEWQLIGWNNMSEMTKFGMPGAFTHGAVRHLVARLPDVHRGDAQRHEPAVRDVRQRRRRHRRAHAAARASTRGPGTGRTRRCPRRCGRSATTTTTSRPGLLTSLSYYAANNKLFLKNFYLKAKRSVLKAKTEGPAAYVFPADDPHPGLQAELLRVLQTQRCEISRATAPFTVTLPAKKKAARPGDEARAATQAPSPRLRRPRRSAEAGEDHRDEAVPGRLLHRPDGPALQPHRRCAARLPVLEPERPAEEPVRRHRLDVRRAVQRPGRARDRREGARRGDGAGRRAR